jgi:hypothetical protein
MTGRQFRASEILLWLLIAIYAVATRCAARLVVFLSLAFALLHGATHRGIAAMASPPWPSVAIPLVAAFIVVGWDACFDPGSSTLDRLWIWQKGGGYFGVPLTNYLGCRLPAHPRVPGARLD